MVFETTSEQLSLSPDPYDARHIQLSSFDSAGYLPYLAFVCAVFACQYDCNHHQSALLLLLVPTMTANLI